MPATNSKEWLKTATKQLKISGIGSARLDALILLEDELGVDRSKLLAEPVLINNSQLRELNKRLIRRSNQEPLSFIREKTEFFGREFFINADVLEPRPESETMLELLINIVPNVKNLKVVDVGTGSGALAITAKLELPRAEVIAVDIDKKCLLVTEINASRHNAKIKFIHSDLLDKISNNFLDGAVLLANLPYVPDRYKINPSAGFEPKIAIYGGKDGLDLYRRLFEQISENKYRLLYIFTESLPFQHTNLSEIAKQVGYEKIETEDLIQLFKLKDSD